MHYPQPTEPVSVLRPLWISQLDPVMRGAFVFAAVQVGLAVGLAILEIATERAKKEGTEDKLHASLVRLGENVSDSQLETLYAEPPAIDAMAGTLRDVRHVR
jgi:hypothetical protein